LDSQRNSLWRGTEGKERERGEGERRGGKGGEGRKERKR
jgi:hypothetical protein